MSSTIYTKNWRLRLRHCLSCTPSELVLASAMFALLLLFPATSSASDSTFQCIPSGFSLGLPPIQGPIDEFAVYDIDIVAGPVSFGTMQERLAEQLHKSSLFSGVTTYGDGPHPDSNDMTLFISIPVIRQLQADQPRRYELIVDITLVENVGGYELMGKSYPLTYDSPYSYSISSAERFNADLQFAFATVISSIVVDLNQRLNSATDRAFIDLIDRKTVTHSHLESLWILPTIIEPTSPGLANYSRFVEQHLYERLARKNCFEFQSLPDDLNKCISEPAISDTSQLINALRRCWNAEDVSHGMILATFLSADGQLNNVRTLLILLPTYDVLYDRSITSTGGWHLGNALEKLTGGLAQASHAVPH